METNTHILEQHLIDSEATILEGLRKLNDLSGKNMTLFVTDSSGNVTGTLTDGDVRRAMIAGAAMDHKVGQVMHTDFRAIRGDEIDVSLIRQCRERGIKLLPWLNDDGTLRQIVDLSDGRSLLPVSAILMAGGKGERLRPMTLTTPKPLLKIGGKAIIDYNVEALVRCGIKDIYVTVRYLADQMIEHFETPIYDVKVKCLTEDQPLGTIGSARMAPLHDEGCTIVMNSDLLTNISFEDMYLHHIATGAAITIASIPYQVSVPFAILTIDDDDTVTGLEEKPSYSHFANAGIYIIDNRLIRALPEGMRIDATDLIESAINAGYRVTHFPINGTWIDVGSPADFRQATELIKYVGR